ncbi:MAG: hypothetical protein JNM33_05535 [Rubrivivax sp.]|nr:hypothetical protein [Rubrivivax sp.]
MSRTQLVRSASLAVVAIAAIIAVEPALAFDPQPDPPAVWWDSIQRLWRLLIIR